MNALCTTRIDGAGFNGLHARTDVCYPQHYLGIVDGKAKYNAALRSSSQA